MEEPYSYDLRITARNHKLLYDLLQALVEGKDNTREFLSQADQHLDVSVPSYEEIVMLLKAVSSKDKSTK